jgi:hypothetical protein
MAGEKRIVKLADWVIVEKRGPDATSQSEYTQVTFPPVPEDVVIQVPSLPTRNGQRRA